MKIRPEPLIEKKWKWRDKYSFDFEDIKSAVAFYKRYKDNGIVDLLSEKPNVHKLWVKQSIELGFKPNVKPMDAIRQMHRYLYSYNNWLFDYCFSDVIE